MMDSFYKLSVCKHAILPSKEWLLSVGVRTEHTQVEHLTVLNWISLKKTCLKQTLQLILLQLHGRL
jgi:hypothetical protein